jgi:plasmid rolling circle replication initiator protein Rep
MQSCNCDNSILPIDDGKTQTFLTDYSAKDKTWDSHRAFGDDVASILNDSHSLVHQKQAKRMTECAQSLEFGWVLVSDATGECKLRLKLAWFCRVRHCPVCQWRRALMWVSRFFDAFPRIYRAYPDMRYIMLTLTIRNCSVYELHDVVSAMNKAWERLTKRKSYPALGFVRSLEVTRGADGSAHPHFHVLLAVKPSYFSRSYLSKDAWAKLWGEALRLDYKPVCDVRIVKPKLKTAFIDGVPIPDAVPAPMAALMSAITETIKYTTKPADMVKNKDWLLEMVDQMRHVRAVALGGIFKDFLSEKENNQDLITASEFNEINENNDGGVYFGWREKIKRYKKTDSFGELPTTKRYRVLVVASTDPY